MVGNVEYKSLVVDSCQIHFFLYIMSILNVNIKTLNIMTITNIIGYMIDRWMIQ